KYLVLYRSSVAATEQMGGDPAEVAAGMELWMNWAGRVGGAMVDMGSPLAAVATVTAAGSTPGASSPFVGGFSVLEADSVDAAKKLLEDHPHFHSPGDPSIEVLEFLAIPGM
ncbi:MAG TPA: YciI family protein, partial [Acidimicrobiales bacterium]|nr:YciI family protein [Acidimicrobiales bacterium]